MTPWHWSLAVWLGWAALFLVLELAAWRDLVPWNTLSWTVWQIFARSGWLAVVGIGLMFSLLLHFALGFPNRNRPKIEDTEGKR